jgi:uncharacterized protein YqhQ
MPPDGIIWPVPKGEYLQYGGQAVVEGVMMRSPNFFAVAVRAPNGGIILHHEPHEKTWLGRQKLIKYPLLRGAFGLIDAMVLGYKSLKFASNVQLDPKFQKEESDPQTEGKGGEEPTPKKVVAAHSDTFANVTVGFALVGGLTLGLFLFNYLPNLLALQARNQGVSDFRMINFLTEIIKIVFFIGYLLLIAQMKEIKEIFKYHGAEHKAINVIENGLPLTLENVHAQTRLHPRCGTSFAIIVLIVGMILFTFIPKPEIGNRFVESVARFAFEIPLLPLIAGVSYELIRFAGKMRNSALVQALFWPGLMTQYITTKEPRDDQVEVAMVSLQKVLDLEQERKLSLAQPEPA